MTAVRCILRDRCALYAVMRLDIADCGASPQLSGPARPRTRSASAFGFQMVLSRFVRSVSVSANEARRRDAEAWSGASGGECFSNGGGTMRWTDASGMLHGAFHMFFVACYTCRVLFAPSEPHSDRLPLVLVRPFLQRHLLPAPQHPMLLGPCERACVRACVRACLCVQR
jgi:hypothetical protein